MAVAGKVAITPKGEYVDGTVYDRLDTVVYNGNLYLAKKASSNVLPTDEEYWMLMVDLLSKLDVDGDSKDNTVTFTSADKTDPAALADVEVLASGETHASILEKASTMFKNVRYLAKMLGTTDISAIGDGTVTDAINTLETDKADTEHEHTANKISGGTFASTATYAKSGTDYTTARIRNIYAGTTDMTAGTSTLTSGNIYVVYE